MRPGQKNRMRGGRGGNRRGPNPLTRSFESSGPDVKVRGTPQHIAEKYMQLARDAHSSGDTVMAESYLQHAEHYYRIIAAAMAVQQQAYNQAMGVPNTGPVGDEAGDDEDDFEVAGADRFTFRTPQSFQTPPQNGNGANGNGYAPQPGYGAQPYGEYGEPSNDMNGGNPGEMPQAGQQFPGQQGQMQPGQQGQNQGRGDRSFGGGRRFNERGGRQFGRGDRGDRGDRFGGDRQQENRQQENRQQDGRPQEGQPREQRQYEPRQSEGRSSEGRSSEGRSEHRNREDRQGEGRSFEGRRNEERGQGDQYQPREQAPRDMGQMEQPVLPAFLTAPKPRVVPIAEPAAAPAVASGGDEGEAPAPRKRGRPRKVVAAAPEGEAEG